MHDREQHIALGNPFHLIQKIHFKIYKLFPKLNLTLFPPTIKSILSCSLFVIYEIEKNITVAFLILL